MNDVRRYQLIAVVAALLALTVAFVRPKQTNAPTNTNTAGNTNTATNSTTNTNTSLPPNETQAFSTDDLPDADAALHFSMKLPLGWIAEYDISTKSIVMSDPAQAGADPRLVAVSFYTGADFTAPPNGTVSSSTNVTVSGQPARKLVFAPATSTSSEGYHPYPVLDVKTTTDNLYYRFTFSTVLSAAQVDMLIASINLNPSLNP